MNKFIFLFGIIIVFSFIFCVYSFTAENLGYDFIENNTILHFWNLNYEFYINRTSGIQLTNHYDDYWSRNQLCLGYVSPLSTSSSKLFCAEDLTGFTETIQQTKDYINITYSKENKASISLKEETFLTSVNYFLRLNDTLLKVTISAKTPKDINANITLVWRIDNLQIGMNKYENWAFFNKTYAWYNMSENQSNTFKDEDHVIFVSRITDQNLRLYWESKNSIQTLISEPKQFNAPFQTIIPLNNLKANNTYTAVFYWIDDEVPSDPEGACDIVSVQTSFNSTTLYENQTINMGCKEDINPTSPRFCEDARILKWFTNASGTWAVISANMTSKISCNGTICFQQYPNDNAWYNRPIRAVTSGIYNVSCLAGSTYSQFKLITVIKKTTPTITLNTPLDLAQVNVSHGLIFNCSATTTEWSIKSLSVWNNVSGTYSQNYTKYNNNQINGSESFFLNFDDETKNEVNQQNYSFIYDAEFMAYLTGFYNKGFDFLNSGNQYLLYNTTDNNLNFTDDFTLMFWYKPISTFTTADRFFMENTYNGTNYMQFYGDSTGICYDARNNTKQVHYCSGAVSSVANSWYHLVYMKNNTNLTIYRNGVVISSTKDEDGVIKYENLNSTTSIGNDHWNLGLGVKSVMDEVIFIPYRISEQEMKRYFLHNISLEVNTTIDNAGNFSWSCMASNNFVGFGENNFAGNRTFYSTSNYQYPLISFISQSPQDINTFNTFGIDVNISYNISDDNHLNLWNATLFFKTNTTGSDTYKYFNGTSTSNWFNKTFTWNATTKWNVTLKDSDIYPATYNFDEVLMEGYNHSNYTLIGQNVWMKILLYNVSSSKNYSMFEIMASNNSGTVNALRYYYCNSSYTTGNLVNPNNINCAQIYAEPPVASWHHIHTQYSKHTIIPFSMNSTGYIGNVKVTERSYFLVRGVVGLGWNISYITNITNTSQIQTTINNGVAWTNFAGTIDAHLHQYNGSDTFHYYACVNDSDSLVNCSSVRDDLLNLSGLSPTGLNVYNPTENIYIGNQTINWTEALSPNSYPIIYYNVTLVDENQTFVSNININTSLLSHVWDTTIANDSQTYFIRVQACDNMSQCSYGYSENFTLNNSYPIIVLDSPPDQSVLYNENMTFSWTVTNKWQNYVKCNLSLNNSVTTANIMCLNNTPCIQSNSTWFAPYIQNWNVTCCMSYRCTQSQVRTFTISVQMPDTGGTSSGSYWGTIEELFRNLTNQTNLTTFKPSVSIYPSLFPYSIIMTGSDLVKGFINFYPFFLPIFLPVACILSYLWFNKKYKWSVKTTNQQIHSINKKINNLNNQEKLNPTLYYKHKPEKKKLRTKLSKLKKKMRIRNRKTYNEIVTKMEE